MTDPAHSFASPPNSSAEIPSNTSINTNTTTTTATTTPEVPPAPSPSFKLYEFISFPKDDNNTPTKCAGS